MTLLSRLIALERRQPPPEPEPVSDAERDETGALLCAFYAIEGEDGLRDALARKGGLAPAIVEGLVRTTRSLVERARPGEALSDYQRQVLTRAGVVEEG